MDLLPPPREREAIVARGGPQLSTGTGYICASSTEEAQCKASIEYRCSSFVIRCLVISFNERKSSAGVDDSVKVCDDEAKRNREWKRYHR